MTISIYDRYYRLNDRENTRVDVISPDLWRTLKGKTYQPSILAFQLANVRGTADYENHKDAQIEFTMSCNRSEAIDWMNTWMMEAVAAGLGAPDFQLRAKFLAAYDLRKSLSC